MAQAIWIIVANSSNAKLFERASPSSGLNQIMQWSHPQARDHQVLSSHQHRNSGTSGRTGLAEREPSKTHERGAFAREIAHWLKKASETVQPARVILFASPAFLGHLRASCQPVLAQHVHTFHPQDLTHLPLPELDQRLRQQTRL